MFPGEEGRLAYEQLDTLSGELIRLGTRRGNAVTTAFWAATSNSILAWLQRTAVTSGFTELICFLAVRRAVSRSFRRINSRKFDTNRNTIYNLTTLHPWTHLFSLNFNVRHSHASPLPCSLSQADGWHRIKTGPKSARSIFTLQTFSADRLHVTQITF